jgi:RNA polymerase sigma-70 factor (ECF subfamily)
MTERTNEDWIAALSGGADHDAALAELRVAVARGLRYALASKLDVDLDAVVEDFTQDALMRILDKLDTFRGESLFTTWANKVAVRVALTELRRLRWRDRSLEALSTSPDGSPYTPAFLTDPAPSPELTTAQQHMYRSVMRLMEEALTERQRSVMRAVLIAGKPIDVLADEMDTNRNALYKLMHDARVRLKRAMADEGLTPEEILSLFN